jgi:predicted amino acid-binding ACT domain protein
MPSLTVSGLAQWGILENLTPTFAQMPNRITNIEFTTVSPTSAKTMLLTVLLFF